MHADAVIVLAFFIKQKRIKLAFKGAVAVDIAGVIGGIKKCAMTLGLYFDGLDKTLTVDMFFGKNFIDQSGTPGLDLKNFILADFGPPDAFGVFKPAASVAIKANLGRDKLGEML